MSKKYVIDDYGNKYEALTKQEIEATVGAGGLRECVFTGCINYNGKDINYNYTGNLPDEAIIKNLLECGIDPTANNLTEAEVTDYLAIAMFSIHFYYLDTEIYVTNANGGYLSFEKIGEGTYKVYPRKVETGYHLKTETPIAPIQFVTQKEYENIAKKDDVFYYVTDAEFDAEYASKAGHSSTATNANIAQYASEDTSKGTIEERLTALGFKEGSFTIQNSTGAEITTNINSIKKQGKYVIANLSVIATSNGINSLKVPDEFKPKEATNIRVYYKSSITGMEMDFNHTLTLETDGSINNISFAFEVNIINAGWETN